MVRKVTRRPPSDIEDIFKECLERVGIKRTTINQRALLVRLVFSGIASYFFYNPNVKIRTGYIEFKKNPEKKQIIPINILKSENQGIVNADTLWRYYKGELASEAQLKEVIDEFVHNLLEYAQMQEFNIAEINQKTTIELSKKRRK